MNNESLPSFEDIANELSQPLFGYLVKMTGNTATADDLLQETLMRIARSLSKFEGRSKVKNWAYRIATNVTIDFFRKLKNKKFVEFTERDEDINFDEDDKLVIDEMNECIKKVIDTLPPDYRAVLILNSLQSKTMVEVAEICEISLSAAKVRNHRAKALLKEALNKKCDFYKTAEGSLRCDRKDS
ncbi:hypothetical protein BVX93_01985 [bacterium B13(2017)]|nr:hypothetical protein BVX93_01985 [bacterium B13(2017)]